MALQLCHPTQHVLLGQRGKPARRSCVGVYAAAATKILTASKTASKTSVHQLEQLEVQLLTTLRNASGRGRNLAPEQVAEVEAVVARLEEDAGVSDPTTLPQLDGKWRLLYTSRPGTSSPIQQTFTSVDAFSVFQEVDLNGETARVNNIVDFGPVWGYLKVEAEASTDKRPLPGFTPRQGAGLALFGRSFSYAPARNNMRIDFQFDRAAFYFKFLPFTIPYPVPFRYLGDETKGWIDVTYMNADGTVRLSRGNKGTLFVLVKDVPIKERLLAAVQRGDDEMVLALAALLQQDNPTPAPARSPLAAGRWRLVWSQQAEDASALQKFGSRQANSFQIIDGETGTLQNLVQLSSWARIQATAQCSPLSDDRTEVFIEDAGVFLGPLKIPAPVPKSGSNPGFVDWLYLDQDLRITRGSKGSLFIHRRE